jgi:regulator of protease activity HflC (stomatin/prohibitin superfamily)
MKKNGVCWTNPLYTSKTWNLAISNFETTASKVNDANGTPIIIKAVIVYKIRDTAKANYAVINYFSFLTRQAESALRICAALYPYENEDPTAPSLRGSPQIVSAALRKAIQERVSMCGIEIVEAKISHLAYSQEIAAAMLKKQQA